MALDQQTTDKPARGGLIKKVITALVVIAIVVVALYYFGVLAKLQQAIADKLNQALAWSESLGAVAPVVFGCVYVAACVLFISGAVLTIGAGALFGLAWGTVYVSIASILGATAAFLIGRYLARDWVAKKIEGNQTFKAIDEAVADEGWKIVGLTRLSPIFPFVLLNYAFGLTKVKLRDYFFASWIAMLPGTFMYLYIGYLGREVAGAAGGSTTTMQWALRIVGFVATIVVTVMVTRIARKALSQHIDEPRAEAAAQHGEAS